MSNTTEFAVITRADGSDVKVTTFAAELAIRLSEMPMAVKVHKLDESIPVDFRSGWTVDAAWTTFGLGIGRLIGDDNGSIVRKRYDSGEAGTAKYRADVKRAALDTIEKKRTGSRGDSVTGLVNQMSVDPAVAAMVAAAISQSPAALAAIMAAAAKSTEPAATPAPAPATELPTAPGHTARPSGGRKM